MNGRTVAKARQQLIAGAGREVGWLSMHVKDFQRSRVDCKFKDQHHMFDCGAHGLID